MVNFVHGEQAPQTERQQQMNFCDYQIKDVPDNKDKKLVERYNNMVRRIEEAGCKMQALWDNRHSKSMSYWYHRSGQLNDSKLRWTHRLEDLLEQHGEVLSKYP